jgi:hypothetical protein
VKHEAWATSEEVPSSNANGHARNGVPHADTVWPAPLPIERAAPSFPLETLGEQLHDFANEASTALQVPVDLVAMELLGALSTAVGRRVVFEVRPGWTESSSLYLMSLLHSGERKSQADKEVFGPLRRFEREERDRRAAGRVRALSRLDVLKKRADAALALAAKTDSREPFELETNERAASDARQALEDCKVPPVFSIFIDDATPEAIAERISALGFAACASPEGELMAVIAGRYSRNSEPNLGVLLKAHSRDAMVVTRRSAPPLELDAPVLSIALAVQPDVLAYCASKPGFVGRGVMSRFLYSLPDSMVGVRRSATPLSEAARVRWSSLVLELARDVGFQDGAEDVTVRFSAAASALAIEFADRLEPRLARLSGDLGHTGGWGSKLTGALCRIAGLLHFAEHRGAGLSLEVGSDAVTRALEMADYFIGHALRAFDDMNADPAVGLARDVSKLLPTMAKRVITRRDVYQRLKGRVDLDAEDLERPFVLLEEHGYLRALPDEEGPRAGRPTVRYALNPALFAG